MAFTKIRPKEEYNRKDVFIRHKDVDLLKMVAESEEKSFAAFLHDLVAAKAEQVRKNKKFVKKMTEEHGERIGRATKG